ncbi:MAG: hypothetical protein LQ338_005000 [Usnochroma carphineum]|nr:MAG: hypothetical protein LQ338_005000 [Usnochroma carphineum]
MVILLTLTRSQQPETPTTGGARSSQASKGVPLDIQTVRHHLAAHGMWYDAPNYDQYQDLRNLVSEILGATPGMDLRPESTKKIRDCLREHATTDESTLLGPLVQLLVKTTKTAPKRHDVNGKVEEVMDMLLNKIAVDQDFIEDGLKSVRDRIFVRGFLPGQTVENKSLGLTDPKPDLTWGLKIPQFPIAGKGLTLLEKDVEAMVKVCPGIQHAFFAIDFGSCEKSIEEVENQAIRTGANLVQARRQLNAKAAAVKAKEEKQPTRQKSFTDPPTQDTVEAQGPSPPPLPPKADLNSIAFTVSWVPQMAKLHVHWFEENIGPQGIWQMTMLNAYLLCREDSLKEFRKDIGNILAWGTYKRKQEVLKVMQEIYPNY